MAYIPYNSGQFSLTPPNPANGALVPLQQDSHGNLKVVEQGPTEIDLLRQLLREMTQVRRILAQSMEDSGEALASDYAPQNLPDNFESTENETF